MAVANRSKCRMAASSIGVQCPLSFRRGPCQDVVDGAVQILDAPAGSGENADGIIQFVVFAEYLAVSEVLMPTIRTCSAIARQRRDKGEPASRLP